MLAHAAHPFQHAPCACDILKGTIHQSCLNLFVSRKPRPGCQTVDCMSCEWLLSSRKYARQIKLIAPVPAKAAATCQRSAVTIQAARHEGVKCGHGKGVVLHAGLRSSMHI